MKDPMTSKDEHEGRREFLRKTAYVVPAILTLQAFSAVAKAGSVHTFDDEHDGDGESDLSKKTKQQKKEKKAKKKD